MWCKRRMCWHRACSVPPCCRGWFSRSGQALSLLCPRLGELSLFLVSRNHCVPRSCWPRTAQLRAKVPLSHPEEAPCPAGSPHSIVPFSASQWGFSVVSGYSQCSECWERACNVKIISWVPSAIHRLWGPLWKVCITKEPCGGTLCLPEAPNHKTKWSQGMQHSCHSHSLPWRRSSPPEFSEFRHPGSSSMASDRTQAGTCCESPQMS